MWEALAPILGAARGEPFVLARAEAAGGGCINAAHRLHGTDGSRYFAKTNRADLAGMFAAEAEGLEEIAATGTLRVPRPLAHGILGNRAYLVLEHLDFVRAGDPATMGRQLAALHRHTAPRFGWRRDNTIGSTPQDNTWEDDWVTFWRERRLRPQFALARSHGHRFQGEERLLDALPGFFPAGPPVPSLLHGDLWGGNAGYAASGDPVVFDPASYFGDRETDLAMTRLFGGFPPAFHEAYAEAWPLPAGHERRVGLYNLYHLLNHANLFGGGYAAQARHLVDELLRA
jgi:protein-ribulosamine 3-kinase